MLYYSWTVSKTPNWELSLNPLLADWDLELRAVLGIAGNARSWGPPWTLVDGFDRSTVENTPKEFWFPWTVRGLALSSWKSITGRGLGFSVGGGGVPPFLAPVGPLLLWSARICSNADNFFLGAGRRLACVGVGAGRRWGWVDWRGGGVGGWGLDENLGPDWVLYVLSYLNFSQSGV